GNKKPLESFEQHLQSQQRSRHPRGNHRDLFVGARHFVTFLKAIHRVVPLASTHAVSSLPPLLVEFREWMRIHRGVTDTTLNNYRLPLIDLVTTLGDQPTHYNAKVLRDFI